MATETLYYVSFDGKRFDNEKSATQYELNNQI